MEENNDFLTARVISEFKGAYKVKSENGEYLAKVTGKRMFEAASREDYPAVGDWVEIRDLGDGQATILRILPRSTVIKRQYGGESQVIAANIDTAFVVESVDRDYNLNRFERYFAIARDGGVRPAIILNKTDLLSREELSQKLEELRKRFSDTDIISTSTINEEGLDELVRYISEGKTYCFLGSSGVGKSSLINKLLGENTIKTGEVSSYSDRGKHITTTRQMYFLDNGGVVVDNPGMREVGLAGAARGVADLFDEIAILGKKCKYADCTHIHEPGCEVIKAVKSGGLDEERYSNYVKLKKESEYHEMADFEKREKDRGFGKFLKKAKKDLKNFRGKDYL